MEPACPRCGELSEGLCARCTGYLLRLEPYILRPGLPGPSVDRQVRRGVAMLTLDTKAPVRLADSSRPREGKAADRQVLRLLGVPDGGNAVLTRGDRETLRGMLRAWARGPPKTPEERAVARAVYREASSLPDMPPAIAGRFQSLAATLSDGLEPVPPPPGTMGPDANEDHQDPAPPDDARPDMAQTIPPPPESVELPSPPPPPEPTSVPAEALEAARSALAAEKQQMTILMAHQEAELEHSRGLVEAQLEDLQRRAYDLAAREARIDDEESRARDQAPLESMRRDLAAEQERFRAWMAEQQAAVDRRQQEIQSQFEGLHRREAELAEQEQSRQKDREALEATRSELAAERARLSSRTGDAEVEVEQRRTEVQSQLKELQRRADELAAREAKVRDEESRRHEPSPLEMMRKELAVEQERLTTWMAEQQAAIDRRQKSVQSQLEELRRREAELAERETNVRTDAGQKGQASIDAMRQELEAERQRLATWMDAQRADVDRRRDTVRAQLEDTERREAEMAERDRRLRDEELRQRERSAELQRKEEQARVEASKRELYVLLFSMEHVSQDAARAIADRFLTNERLRAATVEQIGSVSGVRPEEAALVRDAFSDGAPQRRDLREKAEDLLEEERFEEALEVFDAVVRENPKDVEAWFNRAEVLSLLDRSDEAIASLDRVLELDPNHKATLRELANHLFDQGQFGMAAAHLTDLLKQAPDEADHWLKRAAELLAEGKAAEATLIYNAILEGDPKNLAASLALGDLLLAMDDVERADRVYSRALQHRPDAPEALLKKGLLLNRQGRWGAAVQLFNRAISLRFDYGEAWAAKGQVLLAQGKAKEALEAFDKLLSFDESKGDAWVGKAKAHAALGETDKAADAANRALSLDKGNTEAIEVLKGVRPSVKVPIAPRDATRAAPATKEQGSPIEIADSFLERGDTLLALQRYEQALARDAKDPKALFGKGRALHALGRYQEALRAFAAAVVAAPGVEEYARWRKMCEDRVRKEGRA